MDTLPRGGVLRQGEVPDRGQGRRQGDGFQTKFIEGTGGQGGNALSDDHTGKLCRFGVDLLGNVIVRAPWVGDEADAVVGVVNGVLRGEVAGKPSCLIHGAFAGQRQYPVLDGPGDVVAPGARIQSTRGVGRQQRGSRRFLGSGLILGDGFPGSGGFFRRCRRDDPPQRGAQSQDQGERGDPAPELLIHIHFPFLAFLRHVVHGISLRASCSRTSAVSWALSTCGSLGK